MAMISKRSGADHGKVGLSEKISIMSARTDKVIFLAKMQRREEKHKHTTLFSASSRLCENYFYYWLKKRSVFSLS